jgi:SAM-dependent methyltransferase
MSTLTDAAPKVRTTTPRSISGLSPPPHSVPRCWPSLLTNIPPSSPVLDYGCWGWKVVSASEKQNLSFSHYGCDISTPQSVPASAEFRLADVDTQRIPFPDDFFDLVVASHVIEHVTDPLVLFQELVRVCKPGGLLYLEAPSDRAALCRSDGCVESHNFYSFWDDPTHKRPWPPAALYRLALSYGCEPVVCEYIGTWSDKLTYPLRRIAASLRNDPFAATNLLWRARKWASYAIIRKPQEQLGTPPYRYITLQSVPPGVKYALAASRG